MSKSTSMVRSPGALWLVALIAVSLPLQTAWASLRDDVERAVRGAPLRGAAVAVSIRDAESGYALVSVNADKLMVPASNMKLLTTGAALHALGADFEFTTRLLREGDRLIVLGDGDPAFGDPELLKTMRIGSGETLDVEAFIDLWVKPVVDAGITDISEVVVDDRIFDREFVHRTWPADQLVNSYCAQVSGMNFHMNVLHFFPRPAGGRSGQTPIVSDCLPKAPWLKLTNSTTNVPAKADGVSISRKPGTNDLTFRGNVKVAHRAPVPVTVHDMSAFFAQLLAQRLNAAGVRVGAWRVSAADDPASRGSVVGPIINTPIETVINRCNQESENLYAECLLKRIGFAGTGQPGSWLNGAPIARHIVHERLDDPALAADVIIADGSGLSAENRIAPATMTAWLNTFHHDEKLGPIFFESLAVAGETGTLQKRFTASELRGATVQGKTGFINHVSCLSGYVTMPDGRRRSFSIMVNGLKDRSLVPAAKKLQERIVLAIVEDMAPAEAVQLGGG